MSVTGPGGNPDHQSNAGKHGNYVFIDLAHLDRIIGQWQSIQEVARHNGKTIEQAIFPVTAPAGDPPSERQAGRYVESLQIARRHSETMSAYAAAYAERLNAARAQYVTTEEDNATRLGGK
jgi:hypothetical protein